MMELPTMCFFVVLLVSIDPVASQSSTTSTPASATSTFTSSSLSAEAPSVHSIQPSSLVSNDSSTVASTTATKMTTYTASSSETSLSISPTSVFNALSEASTLSLNQTLSIAPTTSSTISPNGTATLRFFSETVFSSLTDLASNSSLSTALSSTESLMTASLQTSSLQKSSLETSSLQTSSLQTASLQTSSLETSSPQTASQQTSSLQTPSLNSASSNSTLLPTPSFSTSALETSNTPLLSSAFPSSEFSSKSYFSSENSSSSVHQNITSTSNIAFSSTTSDVSTLYVTPSPTTFMPSDFSATITQNATFQPSSATSFSSATTFSSATSFSSATTFSSADTFSSATTFSIAPSPTATIQTSSPLVPTDTSLPTQPQTTTATTSKPSLATPSPDDLAMIIRVKENTTHPANIHMNVQYAKEFSSCLNNTSASKCIIIMSLEAGSVYVYNVKRIDLIPSSARVARAAPDPFVCKAEDLLSFAIRLESNVTCTRAPCTNCLPITLESSSWYWSAEQQLNITFNPNYVDVTCATCTQSTNLITVPTIITASTTSGKPTDDPLAGGSTGKGEEGHSGIILGVIFGILVVVILVILAVVWYRGRRGHQGRPRKFNNSEGAVSHSRGARMESVNSDASDIEFADLKSGPSGSPMHATLDVSSTRYVDLNSKGGSSGRAGQYQNVQPNGQYENVKPQGQYENVGIKSAPTPEYATIGVQTSRPINVYNMAPPAQTPTNQRAPEGHKDPADGAGYSLAQNINLSSTDFFSSPENPYAEIEESQRSSSTRNSRTSDT